MMTIREMDRALVIAGINPDIETWDDKTMEMVEVVLQAAIQKNTTRRRMTASQRNAEMRSARRETINQQGGALMMTIREMDRALVIAGINPDIETWDDKTMEMVEVVLQAAIQKNTTRRRMTASQRNAEMRSARRETINQRRIGDPLATIEATS